MIFYVYSIYSFFYVVFSPLQIPYFAFTSGISPCWIPIVLSLIRIGKPCKNPRLFSPQFLMISQAFSLARSKQVMGLAWTKASVAEIRCSTTSMSCSGDTEPAFNMATISCAWPGQCWSGMTSCWILQPKWTKKTNRHQTNRHQQHLFTKSGKSSSNPQKRVTLAVTFKASSKCKLSMASSENWTLLIAQRYLDPKGYSATKQQSPASVPRVKEIVGMSRRLQCACHESERLEGIACWPSTCCKNFAFYESVHEYVQRWRPERLLCCR